VDTDCWEKETYCQLYSFYPLVCTCRQASFVFSGTAHIESVRVDNLR